MTGAAAAPVPWLVYPAPGYTSWGTRAGVHELVFVFHFTATATATLEEFLSFKLRSDYPGCWGTRAGVHELYKVYLLYPGTLVYSGLCTLAHVPRQPGHRKERRNMSPFIWSRF